MQYRRHLRQAAFSLVELLTVLVIAGVLTAIAVPTYKTHLLTAKNDRAAKDIAQISMAIERYYTQHFTYPAALSAVGGSLPSTDPWGHAYEYASPGKNGADYDLYSDGKNGVPVTLP